MTTTTPAAKLSASRAEFDRVTASLDPDTKARLAQAVLQLQHMTVAHLAGIISQELSDHMHVVSQLLPDASKSERRSVLNMLADSQVAAVAAVGAALADLSFVGPDANGYSGMMEKLYEVNARNTKDLLKPL